MEANVIVGQEPKSPPNQEIDCELQTINESICLRPTRDQRKENSIWIKEVKQSVIYCFSIKI